LGKWAKTVKFIKINRPEFNASKHKIEECDLSDKVITTLGSGGCSYRGKVYPVKEVEVKDLSGAGDSFLAALVVKYLDTHDISRSLVAANEAATIVVQKMGVSLITD
jgi:sugar/nucleoside kinase (ribokinase family)